MSSELDSVKSLSKKRKLDDPRSPVKSTEESQSSPPAPETQTRTSRETEADLSDVKEKLRTTQAELKAAQAEVASQKATIETLTLRCETAEEERNSVQRQVRRYEGESKKDRERIESLEQKLAKMEVKATQDEAYIKKVEGDYDQMAKHVLHNTAGSQEMHYMYKRRINELHGLLEDAQVDVPRSHLDGNIPPSVEATKPLSKVLDDGPPQIHEIDYEFEVMVLTEDHGFQNISTEDKLSSGVCSTIAEIRKRARKAAKGQDYFAELHPIKDVMNWVYAGSGGPREQDIEWKLVNHAGIEDLFELGQTTEKTMRALTYRVRVYLYNKEDGDEARTLLKAWGRTKQT